MRLFKLLFEKIGWEILCDKVSFVFLDEFLLYFWHMGTSN